MKKDYSEYKHTDYENIILQGKATAMCTMISSLTLHHSILTRNCFQSKLIGLMKTCL